MAVFYKLLSLVEYFAALSTLEILNNMKDTIALEKKREPNGCRRSQVPVRSLAVVSGVLFSLSIPQTFCNAFLPCTGKSSQRDYDRNDEQNRKADNQRQDNKPVAKKP